MRISVVFAVMSASFIFSHTSLHAAENESVLTAWGIKSGDTFTFIGDSITYDCGWTEHVENFFYTRYPKTRIRFVNAAVGGDRSWTVVERFEQSIAPLEADFATIMLGMNDGRYRGFDPSLYERYQTSMTTVFNRLDETGTSIMAMSPPHFDRQTRDKARPEPFVNYNGVLQFYGNWVRETAWQRGYGFADINAPMSRLLVEQRGIDKDFTLTTDGIHTNPAGNIVIATALLRAMRMPAEVSSIVITRDGDQWLHEADGGELTAFEKNDDGMAFTFHADALPWVVPDQLRDAYDLASGDDLNRETLRISGLPTGNYALVIDGQEIGQYSSATLAIGIDLQHADTPQRRQAQKVAELNHTRNNHMRAYAKAWFLWQLRSPERAWLKENGPEADRYDEFHGRAMQSEEALKSTPEHLKRADDMIPQVYEAAQTKSQRYRVKPVD